MSQTDLNRLVCAGVISQKFRAYLVRDPLGAVDAGYYGEHFQLTTVEREFLASIRADDFEVFVQALAEWMQQHYPRPLPAPVDHYRQRRARRGCEMTSEDFVLD